MITRCPACSTAFKVNSDQLASAKGAVRCGSCLQVFRAADNCQPQEPTKPTLTEIDISLDSVIAEEYFATQATLESQELSIEPPAEKATQDAQLETTSELEPLSDSSELSSGYDLPDAEMSPEAEPPSAESEENFEENFEERFIDDDTGSKHHKVEAQAALTPAFETEKEDTTETDESWALAMMMQELDSQPNAASVPTPGIPEYDQDETSEAADNAIRFALALNEDPDEIDEIKIEIPGTQSDPGAVNETEADQHDNSDNDQASTTETSTAEPISDEPLTAIGPEEDQPELSKEEILGRIKPEPVEMAFRKPQRSFFWVWAFGSLVGLAALAGQLAWYMFDELNRQEPYRQFYQIACTQLKCTLPPQVDLEKLKASNLVVRSHPKANDALVIDMIILNSAKFKQKFPKILLSFSNLEDKAIASRIFTPSEYLAGELAGAKLMPKQQPIHISLNIVDPGKHAVNYRVKVI